MNKNEVEICEFEMHLKHFFFCLRSNLRNDGIISVFSQVWKRVWILKVWSKNGCGRWHFLVWNRVGIWRTKRHTPPRILRSTPSGFWCYLACLEDVIQPRSVTSARQRRNSFPGSPTDSTNYSQLSPSGHLAITDTPIKRTAAKSQEKPNCRRLTEINSRYYGLSLMRTLTWGPYSVRYKGSWLYRKCVSNFPPTLLANWQWLF